jgi:hypothetical protein
VSERLALRQLLQSRSHALGVVSLISVGFSDIYVRLCAMGVWHDFRIHLTKHAHADYEQLNTTCW